MFKVYKMDGYIVQPLTPSDPSPHDILSTYFNRKVLLMMKGPDERFCHPTDIFPTLDATVKYQVCTLFVRAVLKLRTVAL